MKKDAAALWNTWTDWWCGISNYCPPSAGCTTYGNTSDQSESVCRRSVSSHSGRNIRQALPLPQGTCNMCNFHIRQSDAAAVSTLAFIFLLFGCNCNRKWDPSVGNSTLRQRRWKEKVALCTVEDMALLSYPVRAHWAVHRLSERKGKYRTSKKGDTYHWPWSSSYTA